jgi:hypothetical protein
MILDYPEKLTVTFEASLADGVPRENADIVFMGEGGRLSIFRSGYRFMRSGQKDPAQDIVAKGTPDQHMANWLECVRSRKEPNATVEQGHYGAMVCHMGNLAYQQKVRVAWKEEWNL